MLYRYPECTPEFNLSNPNNVAFSAASREEIATGLAAEANSQLGEQMVYNLVEWLREKLPTFVELSKSEQVGGYSLCPGFDRFIFPCLGAPMQLKVELIKVYFIQRVNGCNGCQAKFLNAIHLKIPYHSYENLSSIFSCVNSQRHSQYLEVRWWDSVFVLKAGGSAGGSAGSMPVMNEPGEETSKEVKKEKMTKAQKRRHYNR